MLEALSKARGLARAVDESQALEHNLSREDVRLWNSLPYLVRLDMAFSDYADSLQVKLLRANILRFFLHWTTVVIHGPGMMKKYLDDAEKTINDAKQSLANSVNAEDISLGRKQNQTKDQ